MKLLYTPSEADNQALLSCMTDGERLMYCLPYNIEGDRFVSGYMAFTDKKIYKLLDGKVLAEYPVAALSDFTCEVMYGNCGFYARQNGHSVLLCRFAAGRYLPKYSVMVKACELLAQGFTDKPITSNEPERFCPVCNRPYIKGTKICPYCRDRSDVYKKLWGMTKGLRLMLFFPVFAALASMILQFVVPAIQKIAVNRFIQPAEGVQRGTIPSFLAIVVAIVTLDLFQRALSVVQGRMASISGNKFTIMLRTLLYEKIQALSMASIQRRSTGDLMGRINNDVNVVQSFIVGQLPNLVVQGMSFIVALVLLLYMNWVMCLFVFVPLPIAVFCIYKFWATIQQRNEKNWVLGNRTNRLLQDILNGVRVVKNYGSEEREAKRFAESATRHSNNSEANAKVFDTFFPILGFIVRFGSYLILLYGNIRLFSGKMDIGTLHQFTSYSNIIYAPLIWITFIPRNISSFLTSLGKVLEILEEEPEVSDIDLPIDIKIEGDIAIRNVTFGYESYNPVLKNISFDIHKGEMIGIVGHSGCGKSTLINLIMRLYDVNEGEILIDSVNIKQISQNALRSQIGIVLQETHLFSGSIRDNIRYSKPHATDEEVIRAAKLANAHDFIVNLPEGYNTIVGEKGYSLSGGERQRIAIARALIHDPRILILDEATAALDTETEAMIQEALNRLMKNRTTIAIAHRLSTLRNADRLIVLDQGELVEAGTHGELMALRGKYYNLVMAQRRSAINLIKA